MLWDIKIGPDTCVDKLSKLRLISNNLGVMNTLISYYDSNVPHFCDGNAFLHAK